MFNPICCRCSQKCVSVGEPHCLHFIGEPDTGIATDENVRQHQTNIVNIQSSQQHRSSHGQKPHSNYVSEIPSVKMREQYLLTCKVCKKEVDEHFLKERNVYRCCVCMFDAIRKVNLQMHSYTHCPEKTCSLCGKDHREGDLHDSEHTCDVCKIKIPCRTRYGEHLLLEDHGEYLKTNCWACGKRFSDHLILEEEENTFACCFCIYNSSVSLNLKNHNKSHLPNFYCGICREEYCKSERSLHDGEFSCRFCLKVYRCRTELEEHTRIDHGDDFVLNCIMCRRRIHRHIASKDGKELNECCVCKALFSFDSVLHDHLHDHTGFKLFKCKACGKRFALRIQVIRHSPQCMVYKCEICGATFPRNESLILHHSEIHIRK